MAARPLEYCSSLNCCAQTKLKQNRCFEVVVLYSLIVDSLNNNVRGCCFLTLTDPLRIQPWSQDRRNQTKSNRESEMSMESRQKKDGQEVASKGHRRDKIENINKKHTDSRNKLEPTA